MSEPTGRGAAWTSERAKGGAQKAAPEASEQIIELLYQVSQAVLSVTRQMPVRDVLQVIVRSARSLVGARYAALGVPDDGNSFAEFVVDGISPAQQQAICPLPRRQMLLPEDGIALRVISHRAAQIAHQALFHQLRRAHEGMRDSQWLPVFGEEPLG